MEADQADKESESVGPQATNNNNSNTKESGMDLAPVGNIVYVVNQHLNNCPSCNYCPLKLEPDYRIGLTTNWKLSCDTCNDKDATS